MKKHLLTSALSALLSAAILPGTLQAKEVTDYFEGFDNVQTGNDQCAIGWSRIFDYTPLGAISYRVEAMGGMDDPRSRNTNVFSVQWQETWDDETGSTYATQDMIVTPLCKGHVEFYLKKKGSAASSIPKIRVYQAIPSADGMTYTAGDEIDLGTVNVPTGSWTKVALQLDEPTRLALWMEHCYFDSFSADWADVMEFRSVQLNGFTAPGGYTVNADNIGNAEFNLQIRAINRGNLPLKAGEADFNFEVTSNMEVLKTVEIPVDLEPGEETMVDFTLTHRLADPTKDEQIYVRCVENVSRTVSSTAITLTAKAAIPLLDVTMGGKTVSDINLGLFSGSTSVTLNFQNKGASPLEITSISAGEGVAFNAALPLIIEGGLSTPVVMTVSGEGEVSGIVDIESNTYGDYKGFSYMGAGVAEGTYTEDFSTGVMPARWALTSTGAWAVMRDSQSMRSATSASAAGKVILPLLDIPEGGNILFAVSRATTATYYECYVKVYASADRKEWTEIGKVSTKDENSVIPAQRDQFGFAELALPAGKQYIALEGVYVYVDNIAVGRLADLDTDLYLHGFTADASAMVNYPMSAAITMQNVGPQAIAEGECAIELLADGKKIATLSGAELGEIVNDGGKASTFTLSAIPHLEAERTMLKAVVKAGNLMVETDEIPVAIAAETFDNTVVVGKRDVEENMANIPMRAADNNSLSEFIYTASQLGIDAGEKISALSFYYSIIAERNPEKTVKLWIENTDLSEVPVPAAGKAFADTASMTLVTCKEFTFARTTQRDFDKYQLLRLPFSEPFEYTGKNLRIIVEQESSNFVSASFLSFPGGKSLYASDDNLATMKSARPMSTTNTPVALLTLDKVAPVISGKVTSTGRDPRPIAASKITLASDGVEYYGTTDIAGDFAIEVKQAQREYSTLIAASAFKDAELTAAVFPSHTDLGTIELAANVPDRFDSNVDGMSVLLTWDAVVPGSLDSSVTYNLTDNGTPMATGLTENSYLIEHLVPGPHLIGLTPVFGPDNVEAATVYHKIDISGIDNIIPEAEMQPDVIYDLNGIRITAPEKGQIYIVNGRKVLHL